MKIVFLIIALTISGCTTAAKLNEISLGMSKQKVIQVLGFPDSTSASSGVEYLMYKFYDTWDGEMRTGGSAKDYFVRIKKGVVESYGKNGDFDSTKVPETKTTIDLNINKWF